jgi:pyruvoyl-dependent arginine decarboxylase
MIPRKAFITKGTGVHKDKLASFELALRAARIEKFNLVCVSSILPPNCKIVPKEEGLLEAVLKLIFPFSYDFILTSLLTIIWIIAA